jgi:hypothetical protein
MVFNVYQINRISNTWKTEETFARDSSSMVPPYEGIPYTYAEQKL